MIRMLKGSGSPGMPEPAGPAPSIAIPSPSGSSLPSTLAPPSGASSSSASTGAGAGASLPASTAAPFEVKETLTAALKKDLEDSDMCLGIAEAGVLGAHLGIGAKVHVLEQETGSAEPVDPRQPRGLSPGPTIGSGPEAPHPWGWVILYADRHWTLLRESRPHEHHKYVLGGKGYVELWGDAFGQAVEVRRNSLSATLHCWRHSMQPGVDEIRRYRSHIAGHMDDAALARLAVELSLDLLQHGRRLDPATGCFPGLGPAATACLLHDADFMGRYYEAHATRGLESVAR